MRATGSNRARIRAASRLTVTGRFAAGAGRLADGSV
jgi:hypothetical protein